MHDVRNILHFLIEYVANIVFNTQKLIIIFFFCTFPLEKQVFFTCSLTLLSTHPLLTINLRSWLLNRKEKQSILKMYAKKVGLNDRGCYIAIALAILLFFLLVIIIAMAASWPGKGYTSILQLTMILIKFKTFVFLMGKTTADNLKTLLEESLSTFEIISFKTFFELSYV